MFGATCKRYHALCKKEKNIEARAIRKAIQEEDKAILEYLDPLFARVPIVPDSCCFVDECVALIGMCRGDLKMIGHDGLFDPIEYDDLTTLDFRGGDRLVRAFITWRGIIEFIAALSVKRGARLIDTLFKNTNERTVEWLDKLLAIFEKKMPRILAESKYIDYVPKRPISNRVL
jgi:hypothetical protein